MTLVCEFVIELTPRRCFLRAPLGVFLGPRCGARCEPANAIGQCSAGACRVGACVGAVVLWWASLRPSLLPRAAVIQAAISAICHTVGHGIGGGACVASQIVSMSVLDGSVTKRAAMAASTNAHQIGSQN